MIHEETRSFTKKAMPSCFFVDRYLFEHALLFIYLPIIHLPQAAGYDCFFYCTKEQGCTQIDKI